MVSWRKFSQVWVKASIYVCCITFLTFHNKSHNMKAFVILSHSWSPFLLLNCLYGKNNFCWSLCSLLEYFCDKKLPPDYPCKSQDHNHQWADLFMPWLPYDKRNCEQKVVRLVLEYDSLHFTQCMAMSPHNIVYKQTWYPSECFGDMFIKREGSLNYWLIWH